MSEQVLHPTLSKMPSGLSVKKRETFTSLPWVFEYEDVDSLLDQAISKDTPAPYGAVLWNSSVVAARWLLEQDLRRQRVIDLGAGNGLCALTAAQLGAEAWALDVDDHALHLVAQAAKEQNLKILTKNFDVFSNEKLPRCALLVVADVLYEPELAEKVAEHVFDAFKQGTSVLVTDPQRYSRQVFLKKLHVLGLKTDFIDEKVLLDAQEQTIGTLWLKA